MLKTIFHRHYAGLSLQKKVSVALFLMTALATGVLIFVSAGQNSAVLLRKTIREQTQNATLAADGVASVMNHAISLSKLASLNNTMQQLVGNEEKLQRSEIYNLEYIIKDEWNYLVQTSGEIAAIIAYMTNERVCASSCVNTIQYRKIGQKPIRFETESLAYTNKPTILNTRSVAYLDGKAQTNVVTLYRPIISYLTTNLCGILQFDILESTLCNVFSGVATTEDSTIQMVDQNGFIISARDKSRIYKRLDLGRKKYEYEDSGASIYTLDKRDYLMIEQPVSGFNWRIVQMIPLKSLLRESTEVTKNMYILLGVILLLSLLPIRVLSRAVTRPLIRLAAVMEKAGSGDLTVRATVASKDEVGRLSLVFNNMLEQISRLMTRMVREQSEKRKYELLAMQEQIKPHFLYNSLDNLSAMIFLKNNDEAFRMCRLLGQFYRDSLSGGRSLIPVEKELEIARNFLEIQSMRFCGKFSYTLEMEESARDRLVPKMIVQPLVENAIRHGIRDCDYPGRIDIRAQTQNDAVLLTVTDNGKGFPGEKMQALMDGSSLKREGDGFGLTSVRDRLQIYDDPACGLRIVNHEKGCTVSVLFRHKEVIHEQASDR